MKTYEVTIKEVRKYVIEVEAENKTQAEDKAYQDTRYIEGWSDDLDSEVIKIQEVGI